MKDELTEFMHWWRNTREININPYEDRIVHAGDTAGVTLYRKGEYQVELFIVQPNSVILPHIHPNVDSYEDYIAGDIDFVLEGKLYNYMNGGNSELPSIDENYLSVNEPLRVHPNSWHGGVFGKRGGTFISIQRWLNGVPPKFVGDDWVGKDDTASYNESTEKLKERIRHGN
jgi:hypothetical protein